MLASAGDVWYSSDISTSNFLVLCYSFSREENKVTLVLFLFSSYERDLVLLGDYSKPICVWSLFVSVQVECLGEGFSESGLH